VSRLTFKIDPDAHLVGIHRMSPWRALRVKLFGIDTPETVLTVAIPEKYRQNRQTQVQSLPTAAPHPQPLASRPARIAAARTPRISAVQAPAGASTQIEYKGRLICVSQLEDGGWAAIHVPLGADPAALCDMQVTHRFMARILAIASAQIEIDELE